MLLVSIAARRAQTRQTDLHNLMSRLAILPSLPAHIPYMGMLRIADSFGSHELLINVGGEIFPYQLETADCGNSLLRLGLLFVELENMAP